MPDHLENFWPDDLLQLQLSDPEPIVFLKEQARNLGEKTQRRVVGTVREYVVDDNVLYSLYLNSSSFNDNYGFKILHLFQPLTKGASDPFPLQAQDSFGGTEVTLTNMDEFKTWLRAVLSSKNVVNVIGNLLRTAKTSTSP